MVRKYIRKSSRKTWSNESMKAAIEAVINQGSSVRRASIENLVPQATLARKILEFRCNPNKAIDLITNAKGTALAKVTYMLSSNYLFSFFFQELAMRPCSTVKKRYFYANKLKHWKNS